MITVPGAVGSELSEKSSTKTLILALAAGTEDFPGPRSGGDAARESDNT